jgi:hypothetical protein
MASQKYLTTIKNLERRTNKVKYMANIKKPNTSTLEVLLDNGKTVYIERCAAANLPILLENQKRLVELYVEVDGAIGLLFSSNEYIKEVNQLLNSICSILPIANTGKKETLNYEDIENNWEQLALLFFNGAIDVETRQITDIISSKVCELHFFPYRKWFQEKAAELYPQPENETTQD